MPREPMPELDEYAAAEEIMRFALARLEVERSAQQEYEAELVGNLEWCRQLLREAREAEAAVRALLDGGTFRALRPQETVTNVTTDDDKPIVPRVAEAVPQPAPQPAPQSVAPAARPAVAARRSIPEVVGDKIMVALDEMLDAHPGVLDAGLVAKHIGEPYNRVTPALKALHRAGRIQHVRRRDKGACVVLRVGEPLPTPDLTAKQQTIFDAMCAFADDDGLVNVSIVQIARKAYGSTALPAGTVFQIEALERKGRVQTLKRGDRTTPTTYRIAAEHRPVATGEPASSPPAIEPVRAPYKSPPALAARQPSPAPAVVAAAPAPAPTGRNSDAGDRAALPSTIKERPVPRAVRSAEPFLYAGPAKLCDLDHGACRWPVGTGSGADQQFCAKERNGEGSYCPTHEAKSAGRKVAKTKKPEPMAGRVASPLTDQEAAA